MQTFLTGVKTYADFSKNILRASGILSKLEANRLKASSVDGKEQHEQNEKPKVKALIGEFISQLDSNDPHLKALASHLSKFKLKQKKARKLR